MQINRLLEIVFVLLRQQIVTAKELAERFGVSQRTIYRDIDTLSLAGIPVYTEKGKGGGISLLPEFVLSKSILSEKEQDEILSALHGLSNIKAEESNQVLQKLSAVCNRTAVNWLEVDFTGWDFMNGHIFNDFKIAILERRIAEFDYYSSYGEKTFRRIEPMQLWFKSKAWYIKGYCLTRRDIRLFKLTRIKALTLTDERFKERDLLAVNPENGCDEHKKQDIPLKLKIGQEMSYRVFDELSENQAEKQPDGSFIISVTWAEDDYLYGTVLSYGEHIEVLEPERVREAVKNKMLSSLKKYM
jgi:predicted DNA-binding transcriptional regulator YafY